MIRTDEIASLNPMMVGISVYNKTVDQVHQLCDSLKQRLKNTYICLGYVPTHYPKEVMNQIRTMVLCQQSKA